METLKKLFWPIKAFFNFMRDYFKVVVFLFIVYLIVAPSSNKDSAQHKDVTVEAVSNSPFASFFGLPGKDQPKDYNLVQMSLDGPILSSDAFLKKLNKYDNNQTKGLLLKINSPGGSVPPSVEMSIALKRFAERIPVVVYAQSLMASGSYYTGVWATKIVANPGAWIGSIGVIYQGTNMKELMDKIGIQPQVLKAGKYKEAGTFYREWNDAEKEELRSLIDASYRDFIETVAKARKLPVSVAPEYAEGRVFDAKKAKELGLVDDLGIIYDAQDELVKLSGVKTPIWYTDKDPKESFWDSFSGAVQKGVEQAISASVR